MGKTVTITPNSGVDASDPQIKFQADADATFTEIDMNAVSGTFHGSVKNVTSILFEGSQGTLFSVDDNLSSGTIFSVSDITGLPLIEANASGDVKLAEYGREVISYNPILISGGAPTTTTDRLYNDNGTLKFGTTTLGQGMSNFILEDDSGDEVSISDGEEVKFIGDGLTINWTDTSDGSDGDPFDLTFTLDTVPVSKGGTNATSFADKAVLITQDSGTDTVAAVAIDANGELLIGGTSGPAVATLTQGSNMTITNADGGITLASSGGAGVSDEDLKENVEDLDIDALNKVDELRPVEFDWNQTASDEFNGISGHDIGLIAQEVEQVFPEFISEFRGRKTVDYPKLTVILLKAVQELRQEVENLKSTPN